MKGGTGAAILLIGVGIILVEIAYRGSLGKLLTNPFAALSTNPITAGSQVGAGVSPFPGSGAGNIWAGWPGVNDDPGADHPITGEPPGGCPPGFAYDPSQGRCIPGSTGGMGMLHQFNVNPVGGVFYSASGNAIYG